MILFFLNSVLNAQFAWFKTYDFNIEKQEPYKLIDFKTHYFVLLQGDNQQHPVTQNGIIKFDQDGQVIWHSTAVYPLESYAELLVYFPSDMVVAKDASVYFLSRSGFVPLKAFLLNKFDKDGNLLWHKTYAGNDPGVDTGEAGLELTKDSLGLYIGGRDGYAQKYVLYRIDSSGTVIWNNTFSVPVIGQIGYINPIVRMPDNSLRIAYDNDVITDYRDRLMRLDSTGHPTQFFTNPLTGRVRDLKLHPNGNLVYLSEERNPPMFEHGGMRLQMLSPDLDTIWSYLFNDFVFPNILTETAFVRNISIHPDGRILVSGSGTPHSLHLVCFSPTGEILWVREIFVDTPEPYFNKQKINHAIWASDGGILIDGYIYGDSPEGEYQSKIFLLKLDSVGCLEPGCEQTIITPTLEPPGQIEKRMRLWPNPASEVLNVDFTDEISGEHQLLIRDVYGRLVSEHTLQGDGSINIAHLNTGAYAATVMGAEGEAQSIWFFKSKH